MKCIRAESMLSYSRALLMLGGIQIGFMIKCSHVEFMLNRNRDEFMLGWSQIL